MELDHQAAVDIIFTDFRNPSQLIGPPSTRVWFRLEGSYIPMVAPVNYSPSRRLIIGYPASTDPQSLTKGMTYLIINPVSQRTSKLTLVLGGGETKQVLEIREITRTGCVYQPREMNEIEETKKKKGNLGRRAPEKEKNRRR